MPFRVSKTKPTTLSALWARFKLVSNRPGKARGGGSRGVKRRPSKRLGWRVGIVEKEADLRVSLPPTSPAGWRHDHADQDASPNRARFRRTRSHNVLSSGRWLSTRHRE